MSRDQEVPARFLDAKVGVVAFCMTMISRGAAVVKRGCIVGDLNTRKRDWSVIVNCGMVRIGLLSDTHHFLDDQVFRHFEKCHEIWHAGDFGTVTVAERLAALKPLRGVYGNIDGADVRSIYPETMTWDCESVKVLMKHIGGYPPKYTPTVLAEIKSIQPKLFISGHSHILKVMFDDRYNCLHMNPGAAGRQGWHTIRTIIRFVIDGNAIKDCEVVELGRRST